MYRVGKKPLSPAISILIGSLMISLSILVAGGVISPQWLKPKIPNTTVQQGSSGTVSATPAPKPVTVGNLPPMGDSSAKVTVIEFADYQCPFCGAVSGLQPDSQVAKSLEQQIPGWQPYVPGIINDYVKTGKVKFYYRDYAFLGQESFDSANAARCANEQGKFWEYHDKLFASQGTENSGTFSKDKLKQFAADLSLNTVQFNNCVDSNKYLQDVKNDTSDGQASGVNGTPGLFVNGTYIGGADSYSKVKAIIESALKKS